MYIYTQKYYIDTLCMADGQTVWHIQPFIDTTHTKQYNNTNNCIYIYIVKQNVTLSSSVYNGLLFSG